MNNKVKSLYKVKSKNSRPSCVVYRSKCLCGEEYMRETYRNVEKLWSEHENPTGKIQPESVILL